MQRTNLIMRANHTGWVAVAPALCLAEVDIHWRVACVGQKSLLFILQCARIYRSIDQWYSRSTIIMISSTIQTFTFIETVCDLFLIWNRATRWEGTLICFWFVKRANPSLTSDGESPPTTFPFFLLLVGVVVVVSFDRYARWKITAVHFSLRHSSLHCHQPSSLPPAKQHI